MKLVKTFFGKLACLVPFLAPPLPFIEVFSLLRQQVDWYLHVIDEWRWSIGIQPDMTTFIHNSLGPPENASPAIL
jgi:hypothetical protein